jgi:hypothetical protein
MQLSHAIHQHRVRQKLVSIQRLQAAEQPFYQSMFGLIGIRTCSPDWEVEHLTNIWQQKLLVSFLKS